MTMVDGSSTLGSATAPVVFSVDNLTVRFGALTAVDDVTLQVNENEVLGLIGPNGSGKSTFLNGVCGLVKATGHVRVRGEDVPLGRPGAIVRKGVVRTFQTPQVDPSLTCMENVLVGSPDRHARGPVASWLNRPNMWKHDKARWEEAAAALDEVGLLSRANVPAHGLSYGDRRLVEIARALIARPSLLLMDEPAAGLSSGETQRLADLLLRICGDGIGLLIIEHKLSFLDRLVQRLVVLEMGRVIAEGTPDKVWKDPAVVAAYLGEPK
ncbi:MAG: ABC transporter ATP-binding protein [Acidimicrobiia bacterium]